MSLLFTFLCPTNHAKALFLDETHDLLKNLAGNNRREIDKLDETEERFFENKYEEERDEARVLKRREQHLGEWRN